MLQRSLWERWHRAFDAMVTVSDATRRRLEESGLAGVRVIHNGVRERTPRPPLSGIPIVAYAGRLSPEKGLFVLIEALARLMRKELEFRFLVAGDGPLREALHSEVTRLGLGERTEFLGHLSRPDLEQAFEPAWVQVAPSLWDEPFGNVATEALMRGTAAIASRAGGLAEIVEDGVSGYLTPPGDVEHLADRIGEVIANRALAESMGCAGHKRALEKFSESACVESFLTLYKDLCARYA